MYETMSISAGLYPKLDLWTTNKLQLCMRKTEAPFHSQTPTEFNLALKYTLCAALISSR